MNPFAILHLLRLYRLLRTPTGRRILAVVLRLDYLLSPIRDESKKP